MAESVEQTLARELKNEKKKKPFKQYTIEELVKELSPIQKKILTSDTPTTNVKNTHANASANASVKPGFEFPEWFTSYVTNDKSHFEPNLEDLSVETMPDNSYLASIIFLLNEDFRMMKAPERKKTLIEIKKTLAIEMEEKDYHRIFHYSRKRKFKKDIMVKWLIKPEQDWDNITSAEQGVFQYVADYFSLNIVTFHASPANNLDITCWLANIEEPCPYRPTVLLIRISGQYYPLIDKSTPEGYYTWSNHTWLKHLYKRFDNRYHVNYDSPPIEVISPSDTNPTTETPATETPSQKPKYNEGDLKKMTLKELQTLMSTHGLSIVKTSSASGKEVNKRKPELITDLLTVME